MSLTDFARKEFEIARRNGPHVALRNGLQEGAMKALAPYARRRATPIWADEWDVCLVLDACRWDLWKEVAGAFDDIAATVSEQADIYPLARNAECRWSVGSASPEWMSNTFATEYADEIRQTAYVTANPFSAKDGRSHTYVDADVFPLQERGFAYLDEVWTDEWPMTNDLATVDPEELTKRGFHAYQNIGAERTVVHYMQPHIPFRKHPEWSDGWDLAGFGSGGGRSKDIWLQVRDGELPVDEVWNAYAANLEWVLQSVTEWITKTDARILITSDHGNAKGEFGQWSHPPGSANPVLRKVPWVLVEGVGDNNVETAPPPAKTVEPDVDNRLDALGYA
jgi:hypothetical protein